MLPPFWKSRLQTGNSKFQASLGGFDYKFPLFPFVLFFNHFGEFVQVSSFVVHSTNLSCLVIGILEMNCTSGEESSCLQLCFLHHTCSPLTGVINGSDHYLVQRCQILWVLATY